jgi:5-formyltetrahydrofolate cyclo-ligase
MNAKETLRNEARARRALIARENPDHGARLAAHADALGIPPQSVVGAYSARSDEADPALLVERLARLGASLAYPRVAARNAPLVFHQWKPGQVLRPGAFGVLEPELEWPVAAPNVLLVPLLAFDSGGHRLGYGGGFYDRTLGALDPGVVTIGVAYAGQEVAQLPREAHDRPLDMVVSELGVRRFG